MLHMSLWFLLAKYQTTGKRSNEEKMAKQKTKPEARI